MPKKVILCPKCEASHLLIFYEQNSISVHIIGKETQIEKQERSVSYYCCLECEHYWTDREYDKKK